MPGKYKFVDGVMVDTSKPASAPVAAPAQAQPSFFGGTPKQPSAPVPQALVAASTQDDMMDVSAAAGAQGIPMAIPQATVVAIEKFDDPEFAKEYKGAVDTDQVFAQITEVFARYEVPIGLLPKVMELNNYRLNMIIDDSTSMRSPTDGVVKQTCPWMKSYFTKMARDPMSRLTRWEEAEDMLHIYVDILAYLPVQSLSIHFLNRPTVISMLLNMEPSARAAKLHSEIQVAFQTPPSGATPLMRKLSEAFQMFANSATGRVKGTMHYLFTDGEPSDCLVADLQRLIMNRPNPAANPLTLVGCTDEEEPIAWMEQMEVNAPLVCAVDYYEEEKSEVLKLQGPVFPFSKGMWLLCLLVGAINPDDLDDLDSPHPLTKYTMENLLGRQLTMQEYRLYWEHNPNGSRFERLWSRFSTEATISRVIVGSRYSGPSAGFWHLPWKNNQ